MPPEDVFLNELKVIEELGERCRKHLDAAAPMEGCLDLSGMDDPSHLTMKMHLEMAKLHASLGEHKALEHEFEQAVEAYVAADQKISKVPLGMDHLAAQGAFQRGARKRK